ncbi:Major Facilitator Superfamily protein [Streptomyces sp. TLI_053]|uniref:MFS transporter n=1 Tax=Streptomyces sp. TLI_053 TaxID=1855352 RepID=UPI000879AD03|nr:MFS transporter [Streptomyces sp. TLI_053]SDT69989.1 Major Facilitator Superfamily protein [Streptomyces sp. TLI_053]
MTTTGYRTPTGDAAAVPAAGDGEADAAASAGARPGRAALPAPYLRWLAGAQLGALGDAALAFALGWAAAAHGGAAAGLVLTVITTARTALVLVGGAVADRRGARRVMLAGDAVMLAATLALAAAAGVLGSPLGLLLLAALVIGVVDAFYLPASGSVPRLLVPAADLPRALALRQAGGQAAALLGAPLGGALVAAGGLPAAALADAASFAVLLLVLLLLPVSDPRPAPPAGIGKAKNSTARNSTAGIGTAGNSTAGNSTAGNSTERPSGPVREAVAGVRLVSGDRLLRAALLLAGAAAGAVLPVVSLLGPLLARSAGWGAGAAGLVAGAQGAGVLVVAVLLARRGARPGRPPRGAGAEAAAGLCAAAAGIALLAAAPVPAAAVTGGLLTGAGSGLFAGRLGPLVLGAAPDTHLSRVQALLTLVQSAALVLSTGVLGLLADTAGPRLPIALCALATAAAGVLALASPVLRRA